ncbi:MAG: tetratricopeptide repeat protein [Gammaproteobacteria bacterium]|nr:tetratricopeptide repeat protein [Gammaproteobacteria bacterium]
MVYDTDEEQIEAIKGWWNENGTSVVVGIILVLAVLFGSRYWQSSQVSLTEAASDIYTELADNIQANIDIEIDDAELNIALGLHEELKNNFSSTIYSRYSALIMARIYVQRSELEDAAQELQWVLDNPSLSFLSSVDDELNLTARSRLARVVLAQGDANGALLILDEVESGTFAGTFAEIRGDAYVELGRTEDAIEAYQTALNIGTNAEVVELKLNDIRS